MTARPFALGLTGSIGMGKSTAAAMFAAEGVPVWDADEAVTRIYGPGGGGARALAGIVPEAAPHPGGAVRKNRLKQAVDADPSILEKIETVIHPLVRRDREEFMEQAARDGARLAVAEVPLLYESGAESEFDAVAVVSAPAETQTKRVMKRPGMTCGRFETLRRRQMPDAEKRRRADFIIRSDSLQTARRDVRAALLAIAETAR